MMHNFNLFSIIPDNLKGLSSAVSEIMIYRNRQFSKPEVTSSKHKKHKVFVVRIDRGFFEEFFLQNR